MEEIKKIEVQGQQYGVADMLMRGVMGGNAQVIAWSHTHNMNDYKEAGTYRIKGERTGNPLDDNLPIMNQGSGHTIEGILYVLDSSLTNGSGEEDDCTITQFLMLSNRVGGQEGDMYMRSAYGVNKDNLTWKPWEKYQTNMEVGVVSDEHTLNPSNPAQAISEKGMKGLIDNGIYSGIYFPPKAMIGTPNFDSTVIKDTTAIETFVMVVINNYAAAGDARCITQIKFAVTNGGVFSMEKRSTPPGDNYPWSQWESVGGGGLPEGVTFYDTVQPGSKYQFGTDIRDLDDNLQIGSGVALGRSVKIANDVKIGINSDIKGGVTIGSDVSIASTVQIQPTIDANLEQIYLSWMDDGRHLMFTYNPNNKVLYIGNSHNGQHVKFGENVTIGKNVSIPDNLSFSIADNILTITDGTNTWKLTAE